jgi:hypothetical protein
MQEWLFRASNAKADSDTTLQIVERFGFIASNAYADPTKKQMMANVAKVGVGDIIHLYFVDGDGGRPIGAFRVVAPFRHPNGALYTAAIPKTSLRRIADPEMREALKAAGYEPDPQLNELCGWPVVVDEEEHRSPSYLAALFPGRNTLVLR